MKSIKKFASMRKTQISLSALRTYPELVKSNYGLHQQKSKEFLKKELPIRLATMIDTIDHLPYGFVSLSNVHKIRDLYVQSFDEVLLDHDNQNNEDFNYQLEEIIKRHDGVVITMAQGIKKYKEDTHYTDTLDSLIQHFLNDFYKNKIGIRILMRQHLKLFSDPDNCRGIIQDNLSLQSIFSNVYDDAKQLCDRNYGVVPDYKFVSPDVNISYIQLHLHFILFEIIKNSMRATVNKHGCHAEDEKLNIQVNMSESDKEVSIKISDYGGGMPQNEINNIFRYAYSTAECPVTSDYGHRTNVPPMQGFGYGLPMSLLYAKFFGGNLQIYSQDGYGTDAIIFLQKN